MIGSPRRRARGESGETLAEIIVTVAIIGLAVVALVGALATGICCVLESPAAFERRHGRSQRRGSAEGP